MEITRDAKQFLRPLWATLPLSKGIALAISLGFGGPNQLPSDQNVRPFLRGNIDKAFQ